MRSVGHSRVSDEDHVVLHKQRLVGADFSERQLAQFAAEGCRFERCSFDRTVVKSASFGAGRSASEYVKCTFDGAKLQMGPGGYARFVDCSFEDVIIEHWFCFAVEVVNCTFSGRLKKVVFNGSVPQDKQEVARRHVNQFEGNDFSRARLLDVSFRTGIDLTKQKLPTGNEYILLEDAQVAVRRARVAFNTWGDVDAKKRARGVLTVMEDDVAAGQTQLLIRVDDYPRQARSAIKALLDTARGL